MMDTTISDEAIEQIRRMQGEIADLRHEAGMYQSLYEVSQKRVEELRSQLGKARTAFERYAGHEQDCVEDVWHGKGIHTCSCGFYEAMIALSDEESK